MSALAALHQPQERRSNHLPSKQAARPHVPAAHPLAQIAKPGAGAKAQHAAPVVSHWAEDGPRRPASSAELSSVCQPEAHASFERLIRPGLKAHEAPGELVLPKVVTEAMKVAWDHSMPQGEPREQGGNVVRNRDGTFAYRPGQGLADAVYFPDENDREVGQTLIGIVHTHPYPYDQQKEGDQNVSFSDEDVSSMVDMDQPLLLLKSNEMTFAIARTAEFEHTIKGMNPAQKRALRKKMECMWQQLYHSTVGTHAESADVATRVTCRAYHLVYYRGMDGNLDRV